MATAQTEIITGPRVHKWTREEYYMMGDAGFFVGRRVELIEGEIYDMSAIYGPHATSVTLAYELMREVFGRGWVVRIQLPITISEISEPEPDVAVVAGKARDFKDAHPMTAALIIEIADSSLEHDRNYKSGLYAKAGIADYWIVNLQDRQIEVYRRPIVDTKAEFGFSYADKLVFKEGDSVKSLAKPKSSIPVADLLP